MEDSDADATDDGSRLQLLSREELEARVKERTADLESLMDTMVDVLVRLDAEGRVTMANRALYDILGYEEGSVVGKPVDFVFASPDDNEQLSDMLTRGELTERLLTDGQVKDVEVYFETADGEAIPMSLSASVMDGADGADPGIVCVAKDISERKEAEETAEFLHSLLRHDLGNKLQVTQGYLDLVAEDAPEELQDFIDDALAGVDEAIELIENVRTLTQVEGETEPQPVDCSAAVRESVRRHEDLRKQQAFDVELDVDDDLRVLGGPLCKELFANLIENALTHSEGSLLRVTASREGDLVRVVVEDDGVGVADADKETIFTEGFTGAGSKGSGLGMHIARRITESYDGDIVVADSPLGGARFVVTLPVADR